MSDPRPIGVFDSGVGGLTVLREILRRLPFESTIYLGDNARAPYGTRSDDEVRRFSIQALDALVRRDVKALVVACNTSTSVALARFPAPLRPAGAGRRAAGRRGRGAGHPQPASRRHRHSGDGPVAAPTSTPSRTRTRPSRSTSTRRPALVPLVEAGQLTGPEVEEAVRRAVAPLLGERNDDGEFIFPLPPSARIDTLLLGCTHYPLLAAALRDSVGDGVAIVDSATATASSLAELLSVNALEAPGTTRGTAADAGMAGHEPPGEVAAPPDSPPADDRRRGGLPGGGRADVRRGVPGRRGRRSGSWARMSGGSGRRDSERRTGPDAARRLVGTGRPGLARHAPAGDAIGFLQAGFLVRGGDRGRGDRPRPAGRGIGPPGPRSTGGWRNESPSSESARAPGRLGSRTSCGGPSRSTPRPWPRSCRRSGRLWALRCRASSSGAAVIDRETWVRDNVATFARLLTEGRGRPARAGRCRREWASSRRRWRSPTAS